MKRPFVDLHLRIFQKDPKTLQHTIQRAANFGYNYISASFSSEPSSDEIENLRAVCKSVGVEPVLRLDLRPRNENELMHNLRRFRRKFDVVCVFCDSKVISRQAAKDHRVDLLNFPNFDYRKRFFDRSEAELASNGLAALEIDVRPLLVLEGSMRTRFLSCLRREVVIARAFDVPLIVSSGVSEECFMRRPRELASLAHLFGLAVCEAVDAVSVNPLAIVLRNREKLCDDFIAPGVRLVREGDGL